MIVKQSTTSSTIQCPHCKHKYTFDDIFIKDAVFKEGCLEESYTCDECNTRFGVRISIGYTMFEEALDAFNEETTIPLRPQTPLSIPLDNDI